MSTAIMELEREAVGRAPMSLLERHRERIKKLAANTARSSPDAASWSPSEEATFAEIIRLLKCGRLEAIRTFKRFLPTVGVADQPRNGGRPRKYRTAADRRKANAGYQRAFRQRRRKVVLE